MNVRRLWLKAITGAAALLVCGWCVAAQPVTLSREACGRATGYAEANKIVTVEGKTHATWLDSPAEGFRVRVATLDHASDKWSPAVTIGEAYDNHGGPALTVDSDGFLHIVYYPHHHAFRYRKSARPNDASEWEEEVEFGERLTYPTLVCGADDTLYLTARRRHNDRPWEVEMWTKAPAGKWERRGAILRSRHKNYAHFQESLAWGPDHQTLHLACRFHEKSDKEAYGRIQTLAYMVSRDAGETWERSDGQRIETPASVDDIEVLERGGVDYARSLRSGAIAVDAAGVPHLIYSIGEATSPDRTVIARPKGNGAWERIELAGFLPEKWKGWALEMAGGLSFTDEGVLVGVATVQRPSLGEQAWGHASNEVVRFESRDSGRTFGFSTVSATSSEVSHWLPNIERATGHNAVRTRPGILYTAGSAGEKNTELLRNAVMWSR
jgi:hypothetical protein